MGLFEDIRKEYDEARSEDIQIHEIWMNEKTKSLLEEETKALTLHFLIGAVVTTILGMKIVIWNKLADNTFIIC